MASNVSPSPSINAVELLGQHYWNEYHAARRFVRSNRNEAEINQYIIDQWNQHSRWNQGFVYGDKWSPKNLNSEEKDICAKVMASFHPEAVAKIKGDQAAWRAIYRIGLRLSDPQLKREKRSYIKKMRGSLFCSHRALFQPSGNGAEVVLIFRRIYQADGRVKKIYKALDMNSGEYKAVTMWPESPKSQRELSLPRKLETDKCPYLVPPYESPTVIPKWRKTYNKDAKKLCGINPFYTSTCNESPPIISHQIPIMLAVLKGVKYLHDKGYAHRDVKPDNIFWSPQGAKLGDYGLMCPLGDDSSAGTELYASPETFRVNDRVSAKCAVWEIAMTGLKFLRYPVWDGAFINLKIRNKLTDEMVAQTLVEWEASRWYMAEPVTQLDRDLFAIYRRCLKVNPDDRPSVEELIDEFEKLAEPEASRLSASKAAEG